MADPDDIERAPRWRRGRNMLARGLAPLRAGAAQQERAPRKISQAEVQQDLQRFAASFMERVAQASEAIAPDPHSPHHESALKRALLYSSAALDIASGPDPEVGLLDMGVFVTLCRDSWELQREQADFGECGRPLLEVLDKSTREVWSLLGKLLSDSEQRGLRHMIARWQRENPQQYRVEGIRMAEFTTLTREAHRIGVDSGLLSGVTAMTARADQALLLGERAMFLAPRIPFLVRMHTRLGAIEVLKETSAKLDQVEALLQRAPELAPLLRDTSELTQRAEGLVSKVQAAVDSAQELARKGLPWLDGAERLLASPTGADAALAPNRVQALIAGGEGLLVRVQGLLDDFTGLTGPDPARALARAQASVTQSAERLLWKAAALTAALIVLFWLGYFFAR